LEDSLKLFVVLLKAAKTLSDLSMLDMKKYGMSPSEFKIIELLYHKGAVPIQKIAEKILMSSGTMTFNIDKLEKKQLLRRVPCVNDRRVIYAELTEQGKQQFDGMFTHHAAYLHSIMQSLSAEEKQQAIALLKRLGKGTADYLERR
jgi:MarR family 2-MHQ and catechol resistance regulon transcriptional repressor